MCPLMAGTELPFFPRATTRPYGTPMGCFSRYIRFYLFEPDGRLVLELGGDLAHHLRRERLVSGVLPVHPEEHQPLPSDFLHKVVLFVFAPDSRGREVAGVTAMCVLAEGEGVDAAAARALVEPPKVAPERRHNRRPTVCSQAWAPQQKQWWGKFLEAIVIGGRRPSPFVPPTTPPSSQATSNPHAQARSPRTPAGTGRWSEGP